MGALIDNDFYELVTHGVKRSGDAWGTGVILVDKTTGKILLAQRTDTHNWATPCVIS